MRPLQAHCHRSLGTPDSSGLSGRRIDLICWEPLGLYFAFMGHSWRLALRKIHKFNGSNIK
jgi:hypothetical protein